MMIIEGSEFCPLLLYCFLGLYHITLLPRTWIFEHLTYCESV
jgi:hypothetical protein